MCGLAGVMKHNMGLGYIQRFSDLMVVSQLRGNDGAGIISVPKVKYGEGVKHVNTKKTTWSSGHLVTLSDFDEVTKGDKSILIGHARQPTRGGSDLSNVHPHRSGNIILVHNGTMSHVDGKQVPQGQSDSKMIAKCIADKGVDHFVQNSYGAYALVWVDLDKQTLNFIRNNERSLWLCEERFTSSQTSSLEAVWWASESNFLHLVLGRYVGFAKDRHTFKPLPSNEHWEYDLRVGHSIAAPFVTPCAKRYVSTPSTNSAVYGYGCYGGYDDYETAWEKHLKEDDNSAVPFDVTPKLLPSPNTGAGAGASGTTNQNERFQYIPPEHRGTGVDRTLGPKDFPTSGGLSVSMLLHDSKTIGMANAARNDAKTIGKEAGKIPVTFHQSSRADVFPERDLSKFACTDGARVRELVSAKPCIFCETKPLWKDRKPPTIYPVKFTETRGEYVCHECVKDLDVQRMLGIG